jgi:S1-C subfamily serine protease
VVQLLPDGLAARYGLDGVGIERVTQGSAAEKAGLVSADFANRGRLSIDVIQAVDGRRVQRASDLYDALDQRKLGEEVVLLVRRGGQVAEVPVRLQPIQ